MQNPHDPLHDPRDATWQLIGVIISITAAFISILSLPDPARLLAIVILFVGLCMCLVVIFRARGPNPLPPSKANTAPRVIPNPKSSLNQLPETDITRLISRASPRLKDQIPSRATSLIYQSPPQVAPRQSLLREQTKADFKIELIVTLLLAFIVQLSVLASPKSLSLITVISFLGLAMVFGIFLRKVFIVIQATTTQKVHLLRASFKALLLAAILGIPFAYIGITITANSEAQSIFFFLFLYSILFSIGSAITVLVSAIAYLFKWFSS